MNRFTNCMLAIAAAVFAVGCYTIAPSDHEKVSCPIDGPCDECQGVPAKAAAAQHEQDEATQAVAADTSEQNEATEKQTETEPEPAPPPPPEPTGPTIPLKFVTPIDSSVVIRSARRPLDGPVIKVARYDIVKLPLGLSYAVEITLRDGAKIVGRMDVPTEEAPKRRPIVPVVVSERHVIKPILDEGKQITYVAYERTAADEDECEKPESRLTRLNPLNWFADEEGAEHLEGQAKPISPRPRTPPYGTDAWRKVRRDWKFFRKVTTPVSDGAAVKTEEQAKKRLIFYRADSADEQKHDAVELDEKQAKATGGGYFYPFTDSDDRSALSDIDNLSSRAVSPDLWKLASKGPNKNVRHIVGPGEEPVEKAKLRGRVLIALRMKRGDRGSR